MTDPHTAETDQKAAMRSLWREAAEKRIESGIDWPGIVRVLFRDLDEFDALRAVVGDLILGLRAEAERLRGINVFSVALWMDGEADRLAALIYPPEGDSHD